MPPEARRHYSGPLRAVIFDWAGTTVDHGCYAPLAVFVELFRRRGVVVDVAQARAPMGLAKRDHIEAIAALPEVAAQWRIAQGADWSARDLDALYAESVPLQVECVADYAAPIPGVTELVAACRARGLKIGSTTGYSRAVLAALQPAAARAGYAPDVAICPDDVPAGRPAPWMALRCAMELGVYPMAALVKVGDTLPDIAEGLNAGMWTVGVTQTGNELGLSADALAALDPQVLAERVAPVERRMREAGAHDVIASAAGLLAVIDAIEERLRRGEQP